MTNIEMQAAVQTIGKELAGKMPPATGFVLVMFDATSLAYVGNIENSSIAPVLESVLKAAKRS